MSRSGAPSGAEKIEGAARFRIAVVAASWHEEIMTGLLDGALGVLERVGAPDPTVVRVPGSFELPVATLRLARARYDGVVALGAVIRGGTPHFEYVCQAGTWGLTSVATSTGVPVGFGLLTCDTVDQARDRAGLPGAREDKGAEAAEAVVTTLAALREVGA